VTICDTRQCIYTYYITIDIPLSANAGCISQVHCTGMWKETSRNSVSTPCLHQAFACIWMVGCYPT
jgi:hypothetical protein